MKILSFRGAFTTGRDGGSHGLRFVTRAPSACKSGASDDVLA